MKNVKIIGVFIVFQLILVGCAHRGEDPVSTYYGAAEFHCYYYSNKTGRVFEGIDVEQKHADDAGLAMCQAVVDSHTECVLNDCVQK